jgi:hypothetical protein
MSEPYVQSLQAIAEAKPVEMPKQPRMTRRQLDFLRNVRKNPNSLPLFAWPRATTLRRWMRRPRFAAAIRSLEGAFEVEARLLMAGAAAQAAMHLQTALTGGRKEDSTSDVNPCELDSYRGPIKQALQVLWMEMTRRQQAHKAGIEQEILRRIADLGPAPDDAQDGVVSAPQGAV